MKILSKGINLVSNLSGSSYLLEIENLAKHYKYVVVLVDNNHQVDSLFDELNDICLLYTSPSPRDLDLSRMPSSA